LRDGHVSTALACLAAEQARPRRTVQAACFAWPERPAALRARVAIARVVLVRHRAVARSRSVQPARDLGRCASDVCLHMRRCCSVGCGAGGTVGHLSRGLPGREAGGAVAQTVSASKPASETTMRRSCCSCWRCSLLWPPTGEPTGKVAHESDEDGRVGGGVSSNEPPRSTIGHSRCSREELLSLLRSAAESQRCAATVPCCSHPRWRACHSQSGSGETSARSHLAYIQRNG
jgi:hypothetical protein